jgi:hypothetical protein
LLFGRHFGRERLKAQTIALTADSSPIFPTHVSFLKTDNARAILKLNLFKHAKDPPEPRQTTYIDGPARNLLPREFGATIQVRQPLRRRKSFNALFFTLARSLFFKIRAVTSSVSVA